MDSLIAVVTLTVAVWLGLCFRRYWAHKQQDTARRDMKDSVAAYLKSKYALTDEEVASFKDAWE